MAPRESVGGVGGLLAPGTADGALFLLFLPQIRAPNGLALALPP